MTDITPLSVGIEVELRGEHVNAVPRMIRRMTTTFDDRSVRTKTYLVTTTHGVCSLIPCTAELEDLLSNHRVLASCIENTRCVNTTTYGTELITGVLPDYQARIFMQMIASYYGDYPYTPEASIHIHVDMRNQPWVEVYKVILLFYAYEQGIYHMACASTIHRGEQQRRRFNAQPVVDDYRYCRPVSVPIRIRYATRDDEEITIPLINTELLLEARTASDLCAAWGMLANFQRSHYCPHRLHGINLASVLRQGSLEWRVFDAHYKHAPAFLDLVLAFHKAAQAMSVEEARELAYRGFPMSCLRESGSHRKVMTKDDLTELFLPSENPWIDELWRGPVKLRGVQNENLLSHYDTQASWVIYETWEPAIVTNRSTRTVDRGTATFSFY